MIDPKLVGLGFLIVIAFVLNAVGVFTPEWLVIFLQDYYGPSTIKYTVGMVPHDTAVAWLNYASWLMFITLADFFILMLCYFRAILKVKRSGYTYGSRRSFLFIGIVSVSIVVYIAIAFIIIAVNYNQLSERGRFALGYSAWLCIASAGIAAGICGSAFFIAFYYCRLTN